jgi:hypothetical protein
MGFDAWITLHKPQCKRCDSYKAHLHLYVIAHPSVHFWDGIKLQVTHGSAAFNQNHRVGYHVWSEGSCTVPFWPNCDLRAVNWHAVDVPLRSFLLTVFCPMEYGPCLTKGTCFSHFRHTCGLCVISGLYPDRHAYDRIQSTNTLMFIHKTSLFELFVNENCLLPSQPPCSTGSWSSNYDNLGEVGGYGCVGGNHV